MKESLARKHKPEAPRFTSETLLSPSELESVREEAFESIILSTLHEAFLDHLDEAGFDADEVRVIESSVANLNFKEATSVFGIPASICARKMKRILESVHKGQVQLEDIVPQLLTEADEKGFAVGYHNSPQEIRPNPKTGDWQVGSSQEDHRDGDLPRAYCATSYKTLYRSKHSLKFLYVVRMMQENMKTDGNWSRTNSFSIVEEVPLDRIDKWVDDAVESVRREKEKDANA